MILPLIVLISLNPVELQIRTHLHRTELVWFNEMKQRRDLAEQLQEEMWQIMQAQDRSGW